MHNGSYEGRGWGWFCLIPDFENGSDPVNVIFGFRRKGWSSLEDMVRSSCSQEVERRQSILTYNRGEVICYWNGGNLSSLIFFQSLKWFTNRGVFMMLGKWVVTSPYLEDCWLRLVSWSCPQSGLGIAPDFILFVVVVKELCCSDFRADLPLNFGVEFVLEKRE